MQILVVSQYFWPEEFRINDLCAELVSRGHKVVVLAGIPNYPDGKIFPDFEKNRDAYKIYKGVEVVRVPMLVRGNGGFRLVLNYFSFAVNASIFGLYLLRNRKFDVVFACQLSPVTIALPAALIAKTKRTPMAMWVLDLWPDSLHAIGIVRSPLILGIVSKLVSFIYSRCDLIFAQSNSFISKISKFSPPDLKIIYSPSWAENIFQQKNCAPAMEIESNENTFNVMFAGNIGDAQDFPCILQAAEKLKDKKKIRWLIVGGGRMAKWVSDEIKKKGLNNNVIMLGRYPVERMPSFYQRADALLVTLSDQPIFSMTIPGKLQSYLAAGIPIVAALNGEGADVVRRSYAGIVVPAGDATKLAASVLELSNMSQENLHAMGERGREFYKKEFERATIIDRIENSLHDLSKS